MPDVLLQDRLDRLLSAVHAAIVKERVECSAGGGTRNISPADIRWDDRDNKWVLGSWSRGPEPEWQKFYGPNNKKIVLCPGCLERATLIIGRVQLLPARS